MRDQVQDRINDFAIKIATINGTGSASANALLMQAIFRMGVPVSGKNVFPSNIQGLPTWYEIRVNRRGFTARSTSIDVMVAMNPETYRRDVEEVRSGGVLIHDSSWPLPSSMIRSDIEFLGVPLARMCVENFDGARERILMKNIGYVGVLSALLDLDLDIVRSLLAETFRKKTRLVDSNMQAIDLGHEYAIGNFACPLSTRLQPMDATSGSIMIDGNSAAALGCVYAGATVGAWYPITPATSLMDGFARWCRRFREDSETGERRYCIVQAEDELAAAGVVIGASWMGARAFTPTSGPGISLMSEFIGLAYYAEIPAVFFDVQRTGPSTGMPTRTQQGDLTSVAYASHGDTKHIAIFPAHPGECFEFSVRAFDIAERFQTPVFVVSDLDIGMNDWMCDRFEWDDDFRPDRGKVLGKEELEKLTTFHRYVDSDGDGICARTLPGSDPKAAYFTRGSGHDKHGRYTEDAAAYLEVVDRIRRKIDGAAESLPAPIVISHPDAELGIITIGGCDAACREVVTLLAERGIALDYMRIRAFPFSSAVSRFIESHERLIVVEQNRDAQLLKLLTLEAEAQLPQTRSILRYGGMPLATNEILEEILSMTGVAA